MNRYIYVKNNPLIYVDPSGNNAIAAAALALCDGPLPFGELILLGILYDLANNSKEKDITPEDLEKDGWEDVTHENKKATKKENL